VLYLLWSYLPSPFLHAIGLHYYPNRWWSLAIPAFIVMLLIFIYVALLSYNVEYLTLPLESVECVVDDTANIAVLDSKGRVKKGGSKRWSGGAGGSLGRAGGAAATASAAAAMGNAARGTYGMSRSKAAKMNWRQMWNEGTDAVMDVPIGGVCEILYGQGREMM
jgi:PIG-P